MFAAAGWLLLLVIFAAAACLLALRIRSVHRRDEAWASLLSKTPWEQPTLSLQALDALPPGARTFLLHAIPTQSTVPTVATVLTDSTDGACLRLLAAPHGGIWRKRPRKGAGLTVLETLAGTSARRQSWILRLLPWCSSGPATDLSETLLIEALLWTPGLLLDGAIEWTDMPSQMAQVSLRNIRGNAITLELTPDGRLRRILGRNRMIEVEEYRDWGGHSLPTRIAERQLGTLEGPALTSSIALLDIRYAGSWKDTTHC